MTAKRSHYTPSITCKNEWHFRADSQIITKIIKYPWNRPLWAEYICSNDSIYWITMVYPSKSSKLHFFGIHAKCFISSARCINKRATKIGHPYPPVIKADLLTRTQEKVLICPNNNRLQPGCPSKSLLAYCDLWIHQWPRYARSLSLDPSVTICQ